MTRPALTSSDKPIGIFDSGVGGLTVAHAVHQTLPNENLYYFGDTVHFPYGDKSESAIRHYCEGITHYLISNHCKAIVIACNTASSFGYEAVRAIAGNSIPVINVIDPVAQYVAANYTGRSVGVIGTRGTIGSNVYERKIHALDQTVLVKSLATPLLAPIVEEGFSKNTITRAAVSYYLKQPTLEGIDALILACTHYPLLKAEIAEFYDGNVDIIDSAEVVAGFTAELLKKNDLLAGNQQPRHKFVVSDLTPGFQATASLFFRGTLTLTQNNIWNNN